MQLGIAYLAEEISVTTIQLCIALNSLRNNLQLMIINIYIITEELLNIPVMFKNQLNVL